MPMKNNGVIDAEIADAALGMLDVDGQGLDVMDRKFLEAILYKFSGGPVGLENVAAAIGESTDTIEDVIEPYLIQQGFFAAYTARTCSNRTSLSAFRLEGSRIIMKAV